MVVKLSLDVHVDALSPPGPELDGHLLPGKQKLGLIE